MTPISSEAEDPAFQVYFSEEELTLIKNFLEARKIYAPCNERVGYEIWKPYMADLLFKVNKMIAFLKDGEPFVEANLD